MGSMITFHLLASVIWVGGMFFSLLILRPVCIRTLEPPHRLMLMHAVMGRFFAWVWVFVPVLLVTGYGMLLGAMGGFGDAPWHVRLMLLLGNAMACIFFYAFFFPFRKASRAIEAGRAPEAGGHLDRIRRLIVANLSLGIVLVFAGSLGRYLQ